MTHHYFAWLGSKRVVKNNVSEKGAHLDIAVRRGLPVPNGGVLLDDFYLLCLQEKIVIEASNMVVIPDEQALFALLYTAVRFPRLDKRCAVRPLFARPANTQLNVDVNQAETLATVLAELWTAVLPTGPEARRDILIQEMVNAHISGTAVTRPNTTQDTVTSNDQSFNLPRLGRWGKTDRSQPEFGQRLQKLLRGVRRTFGKDAWQISWVDDGRDCWLIQVQAIN